MATEDMTPQERLDRCADDMARAFALTVAAAQDAARAMEAVGPIVDVLLREATADLPHECDGDAARLPPG
jgi:hypothetical protein